MANATLEKFGYPNTLLKEYDNWVVLVRPTQVTVGSMVLACKLEASALSQLESSVFAELSQVTADLEAATQSAFTYDKINYLLLMMVDKHVHFHVLPRYSEPRTVLGVEFQDTSWPGPPNMANSLEITDEQHAEIAEQLRASWK